MASGRSSTGRGAAGEKDEAANVCSNVARLRGSYRYTKYGLTPPPAFSRREASSASRRGAFASRSSASASADYVLFMSVFSPADYVADAVVPAFAPADYIADADVGKVAAQLEEKSACFAPSDFVDDSHLPTVLSLVSEASRRDVEKAKEWRLVHQEQQKVYVDLDSDEE